MKISKRIIAAFCLIGFAFTNLYAQKARIFGAQITYSKIDSSTFDVRYHLLLSSEDTVFSSGQISCFINCPLFVGSRIQLPAPTLISAKKQLSSRYCVDVSKLNQYEFSSIINLNDVAYANVKNCCELRFEMETCCRDSLINVFTGENMFLYAEANNCGVLRNENSVVFVEDAEASACHNQAFYYPAGASDTADFDSLSYNFETPMLSKNADAVIYDSGFSSKLPFSVYYPSPLKYPYVNQNADPPIGLYFDPETGDLIFTPINYPQTSFFAIRITEWRKNQLGIYQKVGSTLEEKRLHIVDCGDNYPPAITNSTFVYRTCEGENLCFNITTDDKVFVPTPPLPVPPPDKVHLRWNRGIPGATFTIINKDSLHETGRFCWTPGKNDAKDLPYTFIANASDHFCPFNAQTNRTFRVFVKHPAMADRKFTRLSDGRVLFEAVWTGRGNPDGAMWTVMDQTGTIITDNSIARFNSSDSFWSVKMTDTLYLKNSGTYRFSFRVNNLPNDCPQTYDDTYVYHTLGNQNLKPDSSILLYPNPCQEKLNIISEELRITSYKVVDTSGRLLIENSIDKTEETIDVSSLNPGVYNLILTNSAHQIQKRFVKIPAF